MDVLILETAAQVERALAMGLDLGGRVTGLAVEPEAVDAVERRGLACMTEGDLVSDELFQAVTRDTLPQARRLASRLDELAGVPLGRPVWGSVDLEIKRLLDALLGHATVLTAALRELEPGALLAFGSAPGAPTGDLGFGRSSPWRPGFEAVAAATGRSLRWLPDPPDLESSYALAGRRFWQGELDNRPLRIAAVAVARRRLQKAGHRARAGTGSVLMVAETSSAVAELAIETARDGERLLRWNGTGWPAPLTGPLHRTPRPTVSRRTLIAVRNWAPAALAALRTSSAAEDALRQAGCRDGVDVSTAVRLRLASFAANGLPAVAVQPERARSVLARAGARLVVSGGTANWPERGVIRAARELAIPVIGMQHGGGMGSLNDEAMSLRVENDMLAEIDCYVAWGDGVAEEYCAPAGVDAVIREPASIRSIYNRRGAAAAPKAPGGRTVVFAPTNMTGNWRRGPATEPPDTGNYRLQQRVVDAVRSEPGLHVVVTLPPLEHAVNPLSSWAAGRAGCEIRRGGFRALLEGCDGVIVSWPFTVLLEAVASDRPVLCIADRRTVEFRPSALELLRRRATVVTDMAELEEAIARFLQRLDAPTALDDGFLRRYGLGGQSSAPEAALDASIMRARERC